MFLKLKEFLKKLIFSRCTACGEYGVYYSHTEHCTPGEPNVYICKYCNATFV